MKKNNDNMSSYDESGNLVMGSFDENGDLVESPKKTNKDLLKALHNTADFGEDAKDQYYMKGGYVVVLDTFFYGSDNALNTLYNYWTEGGSFYQYFELQGMKVEVVGKFTEYKATGRHKRLTDTGIVGLQLNVLN